MPVVMGRLTRTISKSTPPNHSEKGENAMMTIRQCVLLKSSLKGIRCVNFPQVKVQKYTL